jgi:hypothetical protein
VDRREAILRDVSEQGEQLRRPEQSVTELRCFREQPRQSRIDLLGSSRQHVGMLAGSGVHAEPSDALDVQRMELLQLRHELVDAVCGSEDDAMGIRDVHADPHELVLADGHDFIVELCERLSTAGGDESTLRVLDLLHEVEASSVLSAVIGGPSK